MFKNGTEPGQKTLTRIHELLNKAEKQLVHDIKVPICIPGCGKCCEMNSITIKGVEARYISNWLNKQPLEFRNKVLNICKKWLFEPFEKVGTMYGLGTCKMPPNILDQLNQEVAWLMQKSGCPLLTKEKGCLIYPARPLVCQAYGVTRVTPLECPRPLAKIETEDTRAFLSNKTTAKIKDLIEQLKNEILESPYIKTQGFIATMLLLEMEPQVLMEHAYHNEIASAKLAQMSGGHLMWQEQLNESWDRETEIQMLINPMAFVPKEKEKAEKSES